MVDSGDVQAGVERLAGALGLALLIEDAEYRPRWWSAQGEVDPIRARTILQRTVDPAADELVRRHGVATSAEPVRIPAAPQLGMLARWCVPLRSAAGLHGFLWVTDPEGRVGEAELTELRACGSLGTAVLARESAHWAIRGTRRAALLLRLQDGDDPGAADELAALEGLPGSVLVGVTAERDAIGGAVWHLRDGLVALPRPSERSVLLGGAPVPLAALHLAVHRAEVVLQALRAGARLSAPSWDALGVWRLVAGAPPALAPEDLHPSWARVARDPVLLASARALIEHGVDVVAAAAALHVHRTTLYYRLDRLRDLHGVDLRDAREREDLTAAMRLHDFRAAA